METDGATHFVSTHTDIHQRNTSSHSSHLHCPRRHTDRLLHSPTPIHTLTYLPSLLSLLAGMVRSSSQLPPSPCPPTLQCHEGETWKVFETVFLNHFQDPAGHAVWRDSGKIEGVGGGREGGKEEEEHRRCHTSVTSSLRGFRRNAQWHRWKEWEMITYLNSFTVFFLKFAVRSVICSGLD